MRTIHNLSQKCPPFYIACNRDFLPTMEERRCKPLQCMELSVVIRRSKPKARERSQEALMKALSSPRFLAIYSGVLTLAFAATVLCGIAMMRNPHFGIITAHRINIIEPDGTVRLTVSNRADFPGGWIHKQESPRPDRRDAAGMLFMNEEGTEQGGLIWGANQLPDGTIENHGHLSLDQYEENQIFALDAGQEGKDKFSRITIADQGDYPVDEKRRAEARIDRLPADK